MDNLRDIIKSLASDNEVMYSVEARVTAVDKQAGTIDAEPLDNSAELIDIRLQATSGKGVIYFPVVGSLVVITFLNKDDGYVSLFSEIDTITIENEKESLLKLIEDLITEVANLKVTTNSGASIEVINKPQLLNIKSRFSDLLS